MFEAAWGGPGVGPGACDEVTGAQFVDRGEFHAAEGNCWVCSGSVVCPAMEWVDWGDAAAWAGAAAALVMSVVAVRQARLARRESARSADAAERSAAAVEEQVAMAKADAERYRVPWRVEHVRNSQYRLVNASDDPEWDVSIEADFVVGRRVVRDRLGPREAVAFIESRAMDDKDDAVTVRWRRQPGEGEWLEWRHPVP